MASQSNFGLQYERGDGPTVQPKDDNDLIDLKPAGEEALVTPEPAKVGTNDVRYGAGASSHQAATQFAQLIRKRDQQLAQNQCYAQIQLQRQMIQQTQQQTHQHGQQQAQQHTQAIRKSGEATDQVHWSHTGRDIVVQQQHQHATQQVRKEDQAKAVQQIQQAPKRSPFILAVRQENEALLKGVPKAVHEQVVAMPTPRVQAGNEQFQPTFGQQPNATPRQAQAEAQARATWEQLCQRQREQRSEPQRSLNQDHARLPALQDGNQVRTGPVPQGTQQTPHNNSHFTPASRPHHPPSAAAAFLDHSSAPRVSTDTVIARTLKEQYPTMVLTIVAEYNCQLLAYAARGHAVERASDPDVALSQLSWKLYAPPARRLDGGDGGIGEKAIFSKYLYRWSGNEFIIYLVDGRDGMTAYPNVRNFYILSSHQDRTDQLILAVGKWSNDLHEEILVFDQGSWTKSKELYASVRDASWDNVIMDEEMKSAVIEDHLSFYKSRDTYAGLKVPWKRGIIYYGPPGNGKTISIKATMNMLYRQKPEVPTLYVRTLTSYAGPEFSVRQIFAAARRYAPCYLVFEDLDTIVSDSVRSYFLNEVDGLKDNDGIFMVGSTNHLDRLDPGISVGRLLITPLTKLFSSIPDT